MKEKILNKQNPDKMCFVCGTENGSGLHTDFYELENGELLGICKLKKEHQSYPGRGHGGVSAALIDEAVGRAIQINNPDLFGVTIDLNIKYRKPVPLDTEIKVFSRITKETKRMFEGTAEIVLPNGDIAVTGDAKYIKMPIEKIIDFNNK